MQSLLVTYYQRVMLWNMVGAFQVSSLSAASVYLRLIEKLRLTDQEVTETQFVMDGPRFSWKLPKDNFGDKTIELENSEGDALIKMLEDGPAPIRISDVSWMKKIVATLQTTTGENKNGRVPENIGA